MTMSDQPWSSVSLSAQRHLPEQLKARIEEAAGRDGLSVNQWLVRTISGAVGVTDAQPTVQTSRIGGQSFTGWAR